MYLHDYILIYDICIIWFGDYISSTQPICELLHVYMYIVQILVWMLDVYYRPLRRHTTMGKFGDRGPSGVNRV